MLAALLLGGCMKIYPDPELPDIELIWDTYECTSGSEQVRIVVSPFEGTDAITDLTVACSALSITLEDVARERYRIDGELFIGEDVYTTRGIEADLRDGVNEEVYVYFDTFSNLRVAWTFEPGASCASLGATWFAIDIASPDNPTFDFSMTTLCQLSPYMLYLPTGLRRVRGRAFGSTGTVAASAVVDVEVPERGIADVTLDLVACGDSCPENVD